MARATNHRLKTIGRYFDAVADGSKTFEVRKNDRAFQTGDTITLVRSEENGFYTMGPAGIGSTVEITKRITYLLQGGQFGIEPGYCVLGLGEVTEPTLDAPDMPKQDDAPQTREARK